MERLTQKKDFIENIFNGIMNIFHISGPRAEMISEVRILPQTYNTYNPAPTNVRRLGSVKNCLCPYLTSHDHLV